MLQKAEKFGGAIELSCEQVVIEAALFQCPGPNCEIDIVNNGNVPLYGVDVKQRNTGQVLVHDIQGSTVGVGESIRVTPNFQLNSGDVLNVVPIILGEISSGRVAHTCDDQFGYAITVP